MTEIQRFKCRAILDHYGKEVQQRQLVEECAELIQAITKAERAAETSDYQKCRATVSNLIEEIADVEIMLEQIKSLYGCRKQVAALTEQKINRQIERIKAESDKSSELDISEAVSNISSSQPVFPSHSHYEALSSLESL